MTQARASHRGCAAAAPWALALLAAALLAAPFPGADARAETPLTPAPPIEEASPDADEIESFEAGERVYLDAEQFRAAFEGKTVHLSDGRNHYGSEQYLPGDRALWKADRGVCREGEWRYAAPLFCFRYAEDGPHCWRVFRSGGGFFAESGDGGLLLEIYDVSERPLSCAPELSS